MCLMLLILKSLILASLCMKYIGIKFIVSDKLLTGAVGQDHRCVTESRSFNLNNPKISPKIMINHTYLGNTIKRNFE